MIKSPWKIVWLNIFLKAMRSDNTSTKRWEGILDYNKYTTREVGGIWCGPRMAWLASPSASVWLLGSHSLQSGWRYQLISVHGYAGFSTRWSFRERRGGAAIWFGPFCLLLTNEEVVVSVDDILYEVITDSCGLFLRISRELNTSLHFLLTFRNLNEEKTSWING